jgi:hypothetical protein
MRAMQQLWSFCIRFCHKRAAEEERIRRKVHAAEQMLIDAATQQQSMLLACQANSQHTDFIGLRNLVGIEWMLWSNISIQVVWKNVIFTNAAIFWSESIFSTFFLFRREKKTHFLQLIKIPCRIFQRRSECASWNTDKYVHYQRRACSENDKSKENF